MSVYLNKFGTIRPIYIHHGVNVTP